MDRSRWEARPVVSPAAGARASFHPVLPTEPHIRPVCAGKAGAEGAPQAPGQDGDLREPRPGLQAALHLLEGTAQVTA